MIDTSWVLAHREKAPRPRGAQALTKLCWGLAVLLAAVPLGAQERGPFFYAIEALDSGTVVQRGTANEGGIPAGSLILAPNTAYREWLLDAATLQVGFVEFTTPRSGRRFTIPPIAFRGAISLDFDGDGLHDQAEFILGTDPSLTDSDEDGITDGAEIAQGLNPLDGLNVVTGVIAASPTPDPAVDVCAVNEVALVAHGQSGISVFNIFNGMAPLAIARVNTPGEARRLHASGSLVAVADGTAGLVVVDISDPPAARIISQVPQTDLGGAARTVVTSAGLAYVGTSLGNVAVVEMRTGTLLEKKAVSNPVAVQDMAVEEDRLFVLSGFSSGETQMRVFSLLQDNLVFQGAIGGFARRGEFSTQSRRLFVGGGLAYVTSLIGYDTIDVTDPANMVRLGSAVEIGPTSFKDITLNGGGLGLVAQGVIEINLNPTLHHVSLFDVADPTVTTGFLVEYPTPGVAQAVEIFNGLGYVADAAGGLQVINYLAFDTAGQAPVISLDANIPLVNPTLEEGKLLRLTANVSDDVQVRNVEFYVDGEKAFTDGNFPFEFRFLAPKRAATAGGTLTVRARASDTGGNATWTDEITVLLVEDATPPQLVGVAPDRGSALSQAGAVGAFFNEGMDVASFTSSRFLLREVGADGLFGTADDTLVSGSPEARNENRSVFLITAAPLSTGYFRVELSPGVTDLSGNALVNGDVWTFRVFRVGDDRDGDGVPDGLEPALGLDPDNPDTDGDGIFDGEEDFDGDGLTNFEEVVLGTDPANSDSNGNGVSDSLEDSDRDGLRNIDELIVHGTDFAHHDTDNDDFNDADEINDGSNPLNPGSFPPPLFQGFVAPALAVFNPVNPTLHLGRFHAVAVSLFQATDPNIAAGKVHATQTSAFNAANPELQQGRAHARRVAVENEAAPELVKGVVDGPVVSIDN